MRRPGPVVEGRRIHDTGMTKTATVPEGPMRDADHHLPQAFVGALLAALLLVAALLANAAIAAPVIGEEGAFTACSRRGAGH
jgi:hypothetical protein